MHCVERLWYSCAALSWWKAVRSASKVSFEEREGDSKSSESDLRMKIKQRINLRYRALSYCCMLFARLGP